MVKGESTPIIEPKTGQDLRAMSVKEWVDAQFVPVKDIQFGEPFSGKIVSMCKFQDNLWVATENEIYRIKN